MEPRKIDFPRTILMGHEILGQTPEIAHDLDFEGPAVILADPFTWGLAGKFLNETLEDAKYETTKIIIEKASFENVEKARDIISETKADIILGVGGGTVIDVAKSAAFQVGKSFISIPTVASHDGIASPRASIMGINKRHSVAARAPIAVIADLKLIQGAPYRFLAAGVGDSVAKLTATKDWELANRIKGEVISYHALALAQMAAQRIMETSLVISKGESESAEIVLKSLISSSMAMCIAGSSRPASGAEHLFSHTLDILAKKPALHGEQVGVGTIIMAYLHGINWEKVKKTLTMVKAPTTAGELGISDDVIIEALIKAHEIRPERYTILGKDGLTEKAAIHAAQITGVVSS